MRKAERKREMVDCRIEIYVEKLPLLMFFSLFVTRLMVFILFFMDPDTSGIPRFFYACDPFYTWKFALFLFRCGGCYFLFWEFFFIYAGGNRLEIEQNDDDNNDGQIRVLMFISIEYVTTIMFEKLFFFIYLSRKYIHTLSSEKKPITIITYLLVQSIYGLINWRGKYENISMRLQ